MQEAAPPPVDISFSRRAVLADLKTKTSDQHPLVVITLDDEGGLYLNSTHPPEIIDDLLARARHQVYYSDERKATFGRRPS